MEAGLEKTLTRPALEAQSSPPPHLPDIITASDLQATVSEEAFGHAGLSECHCEGVEGDVRDGHLRRAARRPPRHLANDVVSIAVVASGFFRRGDLVRFASRVPLTSCVLR